MVEKDHFHTYCVIGKNYIKKSRISNFLLFMEYIEKTLSEFPDVEDKDFDIIKYLLSTIYLIFAEPKEAKEQLKYIVYLEEKAKKMEEEGKKYVKDFIDFSSIKNPKIKELNNLRVNIRILESLFWNAVREIEKRDGFLLAIPHLLNVLSKYVFWYIVLNYKDELKYIKKKFEEVEFDEALYKKYIETYEKSSLDDYL